jgi:hypothetical protein
MHHAPPQRILRRKTEAASFRLCGGKTSILGGWHDAKLPEPLVSGFIAIRL